MCEHFTEGLFSVCVVDVCFTRVQFRLGVLNGARQLPFTAPGGHKQRRWGSYLPLLLEQEAEEWTLLGSHCNYTQLQGKRVLSVLNSSLMNLSTFSLYLQCVSCSLSVIHHTHVFPLTHFQDPLRPACFIHICCQSAKPRNPTGISCRGRCDR